MISFRHDFSSSHKQGFNLLQGFRITNERLPKSFCQRVTSNVVQGGPKPTGNQHDSSSPCGRAELVDYRVHIIGQCCVSRNGPAQRFQFATEPLTVGVELGSAGQF